MDISVLLPAYNAERYVLQSVQSVLAQTEEDFELLVVDDCSTDGTRAILAGIADPRLRILDNPCNLGVVGSLNRAMAEARGRYIARIDADDYCTPTRFARQKQFLNANQNAVLVATEMSVLGGGQVRHSRERASQDGAVVRWMLHTSNPVGHPSMMFRADTVARLGCYLSEELKYAEDFDFSHRMLAHGDVCVLPDYLTIYRQHGTNLTRLHREDMTRRTTQVLRRVYTELFGRDMAEQAEMVVQHLQARAPLTGTADWDGLRSFLAALGKRFRACYSPTDAQWAVATRYTAALWNRMVRYNVGSGWLRAGLHGWAHPPTSDNRMPARSLVPLAVSGLLTPLRPVARAGRAVLTRTQTRFLPDVRLNDVPLRPVELQEDRPPTLYVVVDTESEFDWDAPMDRTQTRVSSASQQVLAQSVLDTYGIRPIYVVDYTIASQPEGFEPLAAILARHGCVIGAHLHPWTNPPFEEKVSERNSFAGNLPPGLEERKLQTLVAMIEQNFGVKPLFFKAGRYGLSAQTLDVLQRLGFQIDFSIMPLADLRSKGGPDFRTADAFPYETLDRSIQSIPMTRGQAGLLAPLPNGLHNLVHSQLGRRVRLPGLLSRSGLLNTATLTPEGMTVQEQVTLLRAMHGRGHRTFVLHYHSPSLGGHTPYVRNKAELTSFLNNIRKVCGFFLGPFGGLAGNPPDLLPPSMRNLVWTGRRTAIHGQE